MHGRLRDEPVWQRQAEHTRDKRRAAEEEEVPVEAAGLFEGVVPRLRGDGADVLFKAEVCVSVYVVQCVGMEQRRDGKRRKATHVVIVEQQHHQEPKRQGDKHPLDIQVPKVDNPTTRLRRLESIRDRHASDVAVLQSPRDVGEADPEYRRELCQVVSTKESCAVPPGTQTAEEKADSRHRRSRR